jgi:hypothetical protein
MNKRHLLPTLALGLVTGYGVQQDAKDDLREQVETLEGRVVAVEGYLAAQVEADKSLLGAVDRSVNQGFTAGINFLARETLVAAWKARAAAAAQNVPGAKRGRSADRVDPAPPRGGR